MPNEKYPRPTDDSAEAAVSHWVDEKAQATPGATSGLKNSSSGTASKQSDGQIEGSLLASKYRLVRRLGAGGMGTVWLATNQALGSDVAIKLIRNDLEQQVLTLRLMTEARAIARLGHPNIVRVFDVGQTEAGQPFIVMELLRGQSLGFRIRREGRLSAVTAVQTLLPIAHALSTTHAAGIVHRDLKPDNIVLEERENLGLRPVLVDFGIAKVSATGTAKLTQDGSTLGSPEYMSPEQARGEEVDARADMWAFCVVLYEALLGHVPFTDTNYHRLLRRIIDEPIPTFSRVGIQDDALWAIIAKGLRKDPSERFENMRSLGVNLARWLLDMGITEDAGNGSLRATWLQVSTTDARGPLTSYVDSVETLTSVPCEPPTRILLDATLRRRYRISRLVWYSAIFFGSILLTLVAKSWIRKSNDQRDVPGATALAVATATTAHPSTVSTIEHADSAAEPAIAARPLSQTTSSGALAATSGAATPTAAILRPSRPGAQRSLALTPQKSAANQVHSAAIVNRATPAKLDIKTDF